MATTTATIQETHKLEVTGDQHAKLLRAKKTELPKPEFVFGVHPHPGPQPDTVDQIRYPDFENKEAERAFLKLHHAAALRWLGYNGYNNEGPGGHVTVRDPILPGHFWINPFGKSFIHITPDDLCLVNEEGTVVQGGNMHQITPAGFAIHSAVHKARPDAVAAVHCHSIPSKAFSAINTTLEPINQDACRFYKNHSVYNDFGGVVLAREEGARIAEALGDNKAVILRNHGVLTVAKSVDAATYLFGSMDRCMQAQLMADAACAGRGTQTIKASDEDAEFSRRLYTDEMEYMMFAPCFEDVIKASNGALPMHVSGELSRTS